MNPCGLVDLACSEPDCGILFSVYRPTEEEVQTPLCPIHKKARLVEDEESGCDPTGLADA